LRARIYRIHHSPAGSNICPCACRRYDSYFYPCAHDDIQPHTFCRTHAHGYTYMDAHSHTFMHTCSNPNAHNHPFRDASAHSHADGWRASVPVAAVAVQC
jgi:hypothetical protein